MNLDTFQASYTETMMQLVSDFHNSEVLRLQKLIQEADHYILNRTVRDEEFQRLARMKMLIDCYPGCPICFSIGCESDHK